jgi:hypothetical protein
MRNCCLTLRTLLCVCMCLVNLAGGGKHCRRKIVYVSQKCNGQLKIFAYFW